MFWEVAVGAQWSHAFSTNSTQTLKERLALFCDPIIHLWRFPRSIAQPFAKLTSDA